jgi:two-component system chemotaxis response regulator CheY
VKLVLVVDDEEDVRPLFRQRFRRDIAAGADVVLILADVRMPGMDGFQLLEEIRNDWPQLAVYLVTAYHTHDHRDRAMSLGASGYLTKPVDFEELRDLIFTGSTEAQTG